MFELRTVVFVVALTADYRPGGARTFVALENRLVAYFDKKSRQYKL